MPSAPVAAPVRPEAGAPGVALNDLVAQLHVVAHRIERADPSAGAALHELTPRLAQHADSRCTGLMVFAAAMARRLSDDTLQPLRDSLRRYELPPQQLRQLLLQHVPVPRMVTRLSNDTLARSLRGLRQPVLVDVGTGAGHQLASLLDDMAGHGGLPPAMTLIGIDPAADTLQQAGRRLVERGARLGTAVHFHAFEKAVEDLDDADWARLSALCGERPLVNATCTLHRVADDPMGADRRNAVLARFRALEPRCLVLAERDVDHLEPRFFRRFRNAFAHFSAIFQLLDRLPLQPFERDALKAGYFGREIMDVLGAPEQQRRQRHETAASWIQRLSAVGFDRRAAGVALPTSGHRAVVAKRRGASATITACGESLVSFIVAHPRLER